MVKIYKSTKNGFTLVELIVVITILAVLWTIAYISLWWYTMNARDTARYSDVKSIEKVLENFVLKRWIYPTPSNPVDITYKGWMVFKHWTFWDSTHLQIWELSKKPVDPLWWKEYNYSLSSTSRAYNISWVQEWDSVSYKSPIDSTYAATATREMVARVSWKYNGQIVHTSTGWKVYVFAAPTLILTDTTETEILNLTNKFVFDNESNIPSSFQSANIVQVWVFEFSPKLVYSWSSLPRSPATLKTLVKWVQSSLVWTVLYSKPTYRPLLEIDVDDPDDLYNYWRELINKDLWGRFVLSYPKTCLEVSWSDNNNWNWEYTISPNGLDKVNVYCDMEMDWWWWTRIRKRERWQWYTDLKTINKTKWISWTEVITKYTRRWAANVGKQFWAYYTKFETRQNDQNWLCWEHTTISDLVSQITWWTRWDCSRSVCNVWVDANCALAEYTDIIMDDLWEDLNVVYIPNDKDWSWSWFSDDPCINTWHKTSTRNISWNSMWVIQHRIDSSTSLTQLWWTNSPRCNSSASDAQGYETNEVYIR